MTAEFYLQTVDVVFQRHLLPKGELKHRGRLGRPCGDPRHRAARDRRRARRHFGHRPDQGRARHRDQAAQGEEAIFPRQGRRPLRHLQRPQMAREDRSGGREVHRRQRLSGRSLRRPFFIFTSAEHRQRDDAGQRRDDRRDRSSRHGSRRTAASPSLARTAPSSAVAIRPPVRATALLKPDAMATCFSSTEPSTDAVSGATAIVIPSAITRMVGKAPVQ